MYIQQLTGVTLYIQVEGCGYKLTDGGDLADVLAPVPLLHPLQTQAAPALQLTNQPGSAQEADN